MRFSKIASTMEFTIVAATYTCMVIELIVYMRQDLLKGHRVIRRLLMATIESGVVTFGLTAGLIAVSWSAPIPSTIPIVMLCCARTYYHTLLFNLNMRSHGGMTMQESEPSLSHISTALRTRHTDSTGQTDIEIPVLKVEGAFQHVDVFQARKMQLEKAGTYKPDLNRSLETV
ncbi:hypothetical protein P389DRAFT_38888 [Cystobasidium minutum MCA 4210]|uniref:uncharacterized protein n=1 Tax=Cystobasidium minutum MCA 4210 TaxID=1397322 RepID=UPI0034CDA50A|eukprot:jgi/Rhomi1/38888/CE38887_93